MIQSEFWMFKTEVSEKMQTEIIHTNTYKAVLYSWCMKFVEWIDVKTTIWGKARGVDVFVAFVVDDTCRTSAFQQQKIGNNYNGVTIFGDSSIPAHIKA